MSRDKGCHYLLRKCAFLPAHIRISGFCILFSPRPRQVYCQLFVCWWIKFEPPYLILNTAAPFYLTQQINIPGGINSTKRHINYVFLYNFDSQSRLDFLTNNNLHETMAWECCRFSDVVFRLRSVASAHSIRESAYLVHPGLVNCSSLSFLLMVRCADEWRHRWMTTGSKHGYESILYRPACDDFCVVGKLRSMVLQRHQNHHERGNIKSIRGRVLIRWSFTYVVIYLRSHPSVLMEARTKWFRALWR